MRLRSVPSDALIPARTSAVPYEGGGTCRQTAFAIEIREYTRPNHQHLEASIRALSSSVVSMRAAYAIWFFVK